MNSTPSRAADDDLLSFADALAIVLRVARDLHPIASTEDLPLLAAQSRVLAKAIQADRDQPPFDRSTRDGFAVHLPTAEAEPTADAQAPADPHPTTWRVLGQLFAGESWAGAPLGPGEAVEIMTGAPIPPGAAAVVMVEHVIEQHTATPPQPAPTQPAMTQTGSAPAAATRAVSSHTATTQTGSAQQSAATAPPAAITLAPSRAIAAGANIVPRGREAVAGAVILPAGVVLAPAEIALAASAGAARLQVVRRPRVAILSTGDELVELAEAGDAAPVPLAPHQIRNSNSYALAALVAEAGGDPWRLPIARDTRESLRAVLAEAAAADLILLTGGVSMGRHDLVEEVLAELGATFHFTGVRMQPGKPVVFGSLPAPGSQTQSRPQSTAQPTAQPAAEPAAKPPRTPLFGLPGNPVSTEVTFRCFVAPVLHALAGEQDPAPRFALAHLAEPTAANAGLTRLLPAHLTGDYAGASVRLIPWQGSGDLAANARANGYAVLLPAADLPRAGDLISVLLR